MFNACKYINTFYSPIFIMRPSSVGGGRICVALCLSVCLSVRLSVRPSRARMYFVYICTVLRAHIQNRKTSVFAYGPASRMYFSARAEGRISYGHLGRTNSCLNSCDPYLAFEISYILFSAAELRYRILQLVFSR